MRTTAAPRSEPAAPTRSGASTDAPAAAAGARSRWWPGLLAVGAAVAAGVALRTGSRSELWLDEALSVNIARLPPGELVDALARDGHPPLYYVLLHVWTGVFGDGNVAARSLSALVSVAALPLAWLAGRRYGGRACATAALVLLATSPFAIRYATEARMYALVTLLVLAGWLALRAALDHPVPLRLAAVAGASGLLLLTHYWAFYLLPCVAALLAIRARRGPPDARPAAARSLVALAAGGLLFLPWLPRFLEQGSSTGTPWGRAQFPATVFSTTLTDFAGGPSREAEVLGITLLLLALLAVFARPLDTRRLEVDLRAVPAARPEALVVVGTLALATLGGFLTASAFATRYSSIVLPLFLLLAALGTTRLLDARARRAVLVVLALGGLGFGARNVVQDRTQAPEAADLIREQWQPGDLVVHCPDQLGPAVSRLLPDDRDGTTYPSATAPEFVDWVDYAERIEAGDPAAFAADVDGRTPGAVWLAWAPDYRTLGRDCEELVDAFTRSRGTPGQPVGSGEEFEHLYLFRFGPPS